MISQGEIASVVQRWDEMILRVSEFFCRGSLQTEIPEPFGRELYRTDPTTYSCPNLKFY